MTLKEFIANMTFFNWLAIVVFMISLVGITIAIIGFYYNIFPKLKDSWSSRNRKKFDKQLVDLVEKFENLKMLWNSPNKLISECFYRLSTLFFGSCLFASFLFIFPAAMSSSAIIGGFNNSQLIIVIAMNILLIYIMLMMVVVSSYVTFFRYLRHPSSLILRIIELVQIGKRKGYIEKDDWDLINLLIQSELFQKSDEKRIKEFMKRHESLNLIYSNTPHLDQSDQAPQQK